MLESGKDILPIFYDVEPEHLRRPHHGPFAAAFQKHLKRGRKDDIKRWEEALLKVANITGFRLNEVNGDEAQLKRRIVMAVQNASPVGLLQQVVQHRVGLQESVAEVVKQLGRVGILGIVGMGGIGKTTLAKEVYNEFAKRQSFERQTFLQNVRTNDLLTLQKQLVHDLLGDELKFIEEFHNCFARLSRDRKVLIVLDDIDDRSKFDCLIPSLTKLMSQGSRIIVTSRDRNVLNFITSQGSTGKSNLYEVQVLNGVHAQQLFNWHAFYSEQASDRFRDLAKQVADACGGLPLALEVMGAYLFDKKDPKHEVVWKEATRSLRVAPGAIDQKLQNMFNISFEGLSSLADKLMLLDISCFIVNWHENVAMSFWESCISCTCPSSKSPHSSLMRLIDKSLEKVSQKGYLQMHDVIRDMATDVVKRQWLQEVGERSYLCDFIEAKEVLENDKGSGKIRGFSLSLSNLGTPIVANFFARMIGLHALLLDDCNIEGDFSTWPKKLRMLSWPCSPILDLPTTLNIPNLVVLNLSQSQNLTCLWAQDIGIQLQNYQEIHLLKYFLETLLDNIGNLSKLKKNWLYYCKNLKGLPMTFGNLQSLVYLLVKGTSFSQLPNSFFNLEELYLYDRMDLHDLPLSISEL
ncbi:unnamed protein product, partial [Sphagnum jensenii]